MPGLVPGIHVFIGATKDVYGRVKPDHDVGQNAYVALVLCAIYVKPNGRDADGPRPERL